MSRWATGGWNGRGVSRPGSDMSGSTVMAWLVIVGCVLVSRLSVSMPLLTCWRRASRRRRPRGCWRAGSGFRRGRHAGMPTRRGRRGGRRCPGRAWCSPSSCPRRWPRGCGRSARERDHDLRRGRARADRVPGAGAQEQFPQVNDRAVETEFVFGRHAATELSVAYAILAPQRQARIVRSGQEGRPQHDERGDLCPGLQCPAEEGRTIGSQTAALREHARRPGLTSRRSGSSKTRAIPGRRWCARPWRRCGTWSPGVRGCGAGVFPGSAGPQVRLPGAAA